MDLIDATEEIERILTIYDQADNKDELDQRLTQLRKLIMGDSKKGRPPADKEFSKYLEIAKRNGIERTAFYQRVKRSGWSYEDAATVPMGSKRKVKKEITIPARKVDEKQYKKYLQIAKENGISSRLYYRRVKFYYWDYWDAAVKPVKKYQQKKRKTKVG